MHLTFGSFCKYMYMYYKELKQFYEDKLKELLKVTCTFGRSKCTIILPSHCKPTLFVPPWSDTCKQSIRINTMTSQHVPDLVIKKNKTIALSFCLHIVKITKFVPPWSVSCKQFRINANTSQSVPDLVIKNKMIFDKVNILQVLVYCDVQI